MTENYYLIFAYILYCICRFFMARLSVTPITFALCARDPQKIWLSLCSKGFEEPQFDVLSELWRELVS